MTITVEDSPLERKYEHYQHSASLFVFTRDDVHGLRCWLNRRGRYNVRGDKPMTRRGSYMAAAHGKLDSGEYPEDAVLREATEELGHTFVEETDGPDVVFHSINEKAEKTVSYFGAYVPIGALKLIRLEPGSGGLVPVSESELDSIIPDVGDYEKSHQFPAEPKHMWADGLEALKRAFAHYSF